MADGLWKQLDKEYIGVYEAKSTQQLKYNFGSMLMFGNRTAIMDMRVTAKALMSLAVPEGLITLKRCVQLDALLLTEDESNIKMVINILNTKMNGAI
jgi:hypothetical protein